MRFTLRKLLTCSLLATYASISLLGEGLHWFLPSGHHHHGLTVVTCTTHCHDHAHDVDCCIEHQHDGCDHDADHGHLPTGPAFAARGCDTHSHACQICEFLFQAVSQPPQVATTPDLHPRVADVHCHKPAHYSLIILGLHAARGPPKLLA